MIDLSNRTVFITGASRGIGEATARKFADCGANVVLAARSKQDIERIASEIGEHALALEVDVADYDNVKGAMEIAIGQFGSIDYLVNNAGIIDPISRLEDSDPDEWGKVIDVNLKGVYHCLHAAFPVLKQSAKQEKNPVVINISSGAAVSSLEGWAHYCASKAGALALTRCINREWYDHGIGVVGLSPGTVATDMQRSIKKSGINVVSKIDWDVHISPQWVAEAIVWLTTEPAREFDGTDFSLKTEENRKLVGLT